MHDFISAIFLGIIEGITEFLPISSTGHLIVAADWLGFVSPGHVFEVFIQLGAILAVVVLYWPKIYTTLIGLPRDRVAQKFSMNVIAACVPVLIFGAILHGFIKDHLYTPTIIATALIVGGIAILFLEKRLKKSSIQTIDDIPLRVAFLIGCYQMLALIPGVSRSGATIMGALALGVARPVAAEFSFFVAIPVMCAAVAFDTLSNWGNIVHYDQFGLLAVGFVVAFLVALATLRIAMGIISKHGFAPFGIYRIVAGIVIFWFFEGTNF